VTIESKLADFIGRQLAWEGKTAGLTAETALIANELLDSLGLMELTAFLQAEFAFEVDDIDLTLDNFGTIAAIAAYVRHKTGDGAGAPGT
jgi:acyl carrier protein